MIIRDERKVEGGLAMKPNWVLLLAVMLILGCSMPVLAADDASFKLKITPSLPSSLVADGHSRIPIMVETVDPEGERLPETGNIQVKSDRGGFSNARIMKDGLILSAGQGNLEFISPSKPGPVVLSFDCKGVKGELKLDFTQVVPLDVVWKELQAEVQSVRGQVLLQAGGSQFWKPVRAGLNFGAGSTVRTGENSWLDLKLADESKLTIQPNTELLIQVLRVDTKNPNLKQSIFLIKQGKVLNKVAPYTMPGSKFEIGTGSASAGIRGTILEFGFLNGQLNLSVYDGLVDLLDVLKDQVIPVATGEVASWTAGGEFLLNGGLKSLAEREAELLQAQAAAGGTSSTSTGLPKLKTPDWMQDYLQALGLNTERFFDEDVSAFHIRPGFGWKRLEFLLDLGFYKNPWNDDKWQWGEPVPDITPKVPNFVDTLAYHGKKLDISYQKLNDYNFDYGLLLSDYHSGDPYHGWELIWTPDDETKATLVLPQDIVYLSPFYKDECASLDALRLEQKFSMLLFKGQMGLTGVFESNLGLDNTMYPRYAGEVDFSITLLPLIIPYVEVAQLDEFGKAATAGVSGNIGKFFRYQAGRFKTIGNFDLNYFGGSYEELKRNTLLSSPGEVLPDFSVTSYPDREGYIARTGIELWSWAKLGVLFIDDDISGEKLGVNFSGKIDRLKLEYGLSRYDQNDITDYDWFVKGNFSIFGYQYQRFFNTNDGAWNEVELSIRF
jgi:hypothetical protein